MTAELVTRFPSRRFPAGEGDTKFEKFYARYHAQLVGWAVRAFGVADGEDIAQETMARAFTHFDELDPGRDPWPWLCVVARRVGTDVVRFRSRTVAVDDGRFAEMPTADGETPAEQALANDDRRALGRALAKLSASDRRVLRLREFDDLSSSDMAALLECSETAVRQQVFRARRRLAEHFRSLSAFAALPPAALARSARRRVRKLAGKLSAGAGTVAAGGVAMSALVVVGGGAMVNIGGIAPRTVDLTTSSETVRTDTFSPLPDRPAGYAVRTGGNGAAASAGGTETVLGVGAGGSGVTLSSKDGRQAKLGTGARHTYDFKVVVAGQEVVEIRSENTDPNDYSALCNTPVIVCG